MKLRGVTDQGFERLAKAYEVEAGIRDVWENAKDFVTTSPSYETWVRTLTIQLNELGESIYNISNIDLTAWYNLGYTVEQAIQVVI